MHKQIAAFAAVLALSCPAWATLTTTTNSASYTGNGSTKAFTVPFKFLATSDLVVTVAGTTKALGTDYTVKGAGAATGTVTFIVAPVSGAAVVITRTVPLTQPKSLRSGSYHGDVVEDALDRQTMQIQQNAATHAADKATQAVTDTAQNSATAAKDASQDAALATETATRISDTATTRAQVANAALGGGVNIADTSTVQATGAPTARQLRDHLASIPDAKPRLADAQSFTDNVLNVDHSGLNNGTAQNYGINIWNRPDNAAAPTAFTGANSALVIHQYSDLGPAMQIDDTRSSAFILLKHAHNETNSTGTHGTGVYLDLWGYSTNAVYPASEPVRLGQLNSFLGFIGFDSSRPWSFQSNTTAPSLQVNAVNGPGLKVQGTAGTGTLGIDISQPAASAALNVVQNGAASAVTVTANAGAAGLFPIIVTGQDWGPNFTTSLNGFNTLTLQKNGTGSGQALKITNKGTGFSVLADNGTANTYGLDKDGMPQIGMSNTAAAPTCTAGVRGKIWFQQGAAGVKDSVAICAKDAADAYAWRTIY